MDWENIYIFVQTNNAVAHYNDHDNLCIQLQVSKYIVFPGGLFAFSFQYVSILLLFTTNNDNRTMKLKMGRYCNSYCLVAARIYRRLKKKIFTHHPCKLRPTFFFSFSLLWINQKFSTIANSINVKLTILPPKKSYLFCCRDLL